MGRSMAGYYEPVAFWTPVLSMFYLRFGPILAGLFKSLPFILGVFLFGDMLRSLAGPIHRVGGLVVNTITSGLSVVQAALPSLLNRKKKKRSGSLKHCHRYRRFRRTKLPYWCVRCCCSCMVGPDSFSLCIRQHWRWRRRNLERRRR
jgi:hypothetical protein